MAGRPTKYKPEYPEALVKHMSEGLSFESFAAQCDCSIECLYNWTRIHPEFSEAKKRATAKSLEFWEKMGRSGVAGKLKGFNVTAWIYTMKCRFKEQWGDKQEVSHVIEDRRAITQLSDEELNAMLLQSDDSTRN